MPKLGVNIDHVATLRQARGEHEPDVLEAARQSLKAGAHSIVCHLREDRRHIQDNDVKNLRKLIKKNFTLELSLNINIVNFAAHIKPDVAVFVPEKRQEITTEGGLDVAANFQRIQTAIKLLKKRNIKISLFIAAQRNQIVAARNLDADFIEIHTGPYANAKTSIQKRKELKKIQAMTLFAQSLALTVNAGHGLKYHDTKAIAQIPGIYELNIGHSIVSQAVFVGLPKAVREMRKIVSLNK